MIIDLANQLRVAEMLDSHLVRHDLQQSLNNDQFVVGWLAYILSQANDCKFTVREWARDLSRTRGHLLGQPLLL